ncbi:MAG: TIM barrel protein [Methanobacteriota archaeon]
MIGGTTRHATDEEFSFWSYLGVDFMQLSPPYDFFLDEGKISQALELKDRYDLDLLVHPRPDGDIFYTAANPAAHEGMFQALDVIQNLIKSERLIPKVILHLSTYVNPEGNYPTFTKEEAINNSKPFYERIKEMTDVTFVLENVYPPGINWEELGYEIEHFSLFDFRKDDELCLDTGHMNLSEMSVQDYASLQYPITCFQLHGNNGREDQHRPVTRSNFKQWEELEQLLSNDKYMVLEVKDDKQKLPDMIEYYKKNRLPP